MDNSRSSPHWAPSPALITLGWSAAALALAALFFSSDSRGRVLFGLAALLLAAASAHGSLVRPRLAADDQGLHVRSLHGRVHLSWTETRTRLRTTRRLGRDAETLEIENGDQLFIFSRLELGTDPRDVLDVLTALRP
ncbi:PH domain-containing protein [Amycolatopsis pigmentata]|uniref:PH domain-containing protein n=1 Tax=Amycolatopsis pigmentata TaxID=450801 RepID=A0ABW5FW21_9PSEU